MTVPYVERNNVRDGSVYRVIASRRVAIEALKAHFTLGISEASIAAIGHLTLGRISTEKAVLDYFEPDWARLRNYEIEDRLSAAFGEAEWAIDEPCPFDEKFCRYMYLHKELLKWATTRDA